MTTYDPAPLLDRIADRTGKHPKGGGRQYAARCPVPDHGDREESMSVTIKDDRALLKCHRGCSNLDIVEALGIKMRDLYLVPAAPTGRQDRPDTYTACGHEKVADYLYRDETGKVVFGVARCNLKGNGCQGFRQWRPDPTSKSGRRWSLKKEDGAAAVPNLPYRLPELLAAIQAGRVVWVVEGEKDADNLASRGYPATCNRGGGTVDNAGHSKWTAQDHARWLTDADVIVVADRDDTGRAHSLHVVSTLMPVARSIELVQAAVGKDASDHLTAGLHIGKFVTVAIPKPWDSRSAIDTGPVDLGSA